MHNHDHNNHNISVFSWNVLYREHEERYNPTSTILTTFTKEDDRCNSIIKFILENTNENTVICLQECSNKIILLLETNFKTHNLYSQNIIKNTDEYIITLLPKNIHTHTHTHTHTYTHINKVEYNVTITYNLYPFRAILILENDNIRIINCHLIPFKYSKIDIVKSFTQFNDKLTIIAGDFNEEKKYVNRKLKHLYTIPSFGHTYKNKQIDYIIFNKDYIYDCFTLDNHNISDHKPILLEIIKE
jgi:endonuclease/exonuclease/phosphatase family metal-dependent hydrolase